MKVGQKAGARAQAMQRDGQESLGPKAVREAEARPTRPHATLGKTLLEGSRKTSKFCPLEP